MADVKEKLCPFRVFRKKTHFKHSQGETTTEKFYDCLREKCAAYYKGGCLRLPPPEYTMRANLTDQELLQLKNDLLCGGQIMPYNPEQESVEVPPHLYGGEMIFVDWHERLSHLEFIFNPAGDGPWYRADDVWECIDPARHKEE